MSEVKRQELLDTQYIYIHFENSFLLTLIHIQKQKSISFLNLNIKIHFLA